MCSSGSSVPLTLRREWGEERCFHQMPHALISVLSRASWQTNGGSFFAPNRNRGKSWLAKTYVFLRYQQQLQLPMSPSISHPMSPCAALLFPPPRGP